MLKLLVDFLPEVQYFVQKEDADMNAVNYSELRKKLKNFLDQVYEDHEPLIITRKNNQNVVVISIEDYNSLIETNYLLSNIANSKRLLQSLESSRSGKLLKKELIEE